MKKASIEDTKKFFEMAFPAPTSQNCHRQLGLHFEELHQMLKAINPKAKNAKFILELTNNMLHAMALFCRENNDAFEVLPENQEKFLDGLGGQLVTSIGIAHMLKLDIIKKFEEINQNLKKNG